MEHTKEMSAPFRGNWSRNTRPPLSVGRDCSLPSQKRIFCGKAGLVAVDQEKVAHAIETSRIRNEWIGPNMSTYSVHQNGLVKKRPKSGTVGSGCGSK